MQIKELTLFSKDINKQKTFYSEVLGLEQVLDTVNEISFKVGESILNFKYKSEITPSHVAFNIPSNSIEQAAKWLVQIGLAIDSNGKYVTEFSDWKAKAVYFYDADNNIMEFIARTELNLNSDMEFSSESILAISEVAIATNSIKQIYNDINAIRPIEIFDGNFERFCALGNNHGLFIIIDKNKKKWYPTDDVADSSDFIIKGDYNFRFEGGRIKQIL